MERIIRPICGDRSGDIAAQLIEQFGSLPVAMLAEPLHLAEFLPPAGIDQLDNVREAAQEFLRQPLRKQSVTTEALRYYITVAIGASRVERVMVIFFDPGNRLLHDEILFVGDLAEAPIYPRRIILRALQLGASRVVLAHNHPSGDHQPSRADIELTRQLVQQCKGLGIHLLDHIVVSERGFTSLQAEGLL